MTAAAFLDRDGVINLDRDYVHRWEDFVFVPGAVAAVARLAEAGFRIVVVTNQSGIARGFYTQEQYIELTRRMIAAFAEQGVDIAAVYHCPHHPSGSVEPFARDCGCRKPAPGMLLRAAAEHGLSLADSILVGDRDSDIAAARAAGVGRAFLVRSDHVASRATGADTLPDAYFDDLAQCVDTLLRAAAPTPPCHSSDA